MKYSKEGYILPQDSYSMFDVFVMGNVAFDENHRLFGHWLGNYDIASLNYKQPAKLIQTPDGRKSVANILAAIIYGTYT